MRLTVTPEAEADVDEAAGHLKERASPADAARFVREYRRAITAIRANPRGYPEPADAPTGHETREFYISRYQYRLIYRMDGPDATVLTVIHARRRPRSWVRRLRTNPGGQP